MEQQGQDSYNCPICLYPLKDPVTIDCGHSFCLTCITVKLDNYYEDDFLQGRRCPHCRTTFEERPVLVKSYVIANLMEELNNMDLPPATGDLCIGPDHVACDFCTKKPSEALMSCTGCSASYCEKHLQNIYDNINHQPQSKKVIMMEPFKEPQENICSRHNEEKNIIKHTDQQCICYHCAAEEYKAVAEKTKRKKELQKRLQHLEEDVHSEKVFNDDADATVKKSKDIFTEVVERVEKVRSEVKHKIRSQQKSEVKQVKDLQGKLEQEITELKRKDDELKQLSVEEDHAQFLSKFPKLAPLTESTNPSITIRPLKYLNDVTRSVSQVRYRLQYFLSELNDKINHV